VREMTFKSKTITVSINANPKKVYRFVSNGANLAKWAATFCRSVRSSKGGWMLETPQGRVTMRIAKKNPLGVVDHEVIPAAGPSLYVPMRVVANGSGADIMFTLFRTPEMSNKRFANDLRLVRKDLNALKRLFENGSNLDF
jgi:hypothetical protein